MELEELFALLAKDYEIRVNTDTCENLKDIVWVVDLFNYSNEEIIDFRGILNQSLQDLLTHICKDYLKII